MQRAVMSAEIHGTNEVGTLYGEGPGAEIVYKGSDG